MGIRTTCIGAYPKPDYVPIRDWFQIERGLTHAAGEVTRRASAVDEDAAIEDLYRKATQAAVADQVACGIDIPTDGEQRRENYIHYHCRHLTGFDFENLTMLAVRGGAYRAELPTIRGRIEPRGEHFLDRDFVSRRPRPTGPSRSRFPAPRRSWTPAPTSSTGIRENSPSTCPPR